MPPNKINSQPLSQPLDADLVNQAAEQNIPGLWDWTGRLPVGRPPATDPPIIRLRKDQRSRPPTQSPGNTMSARTLSTVQWKALEAFIDPITAPLKRLLRYFGELPRRDGDEDVVLVALNFEAIARVPQKSRVSEAGFMYLDISKLKNVHPKDYIKHVVPAYFALAADWDTRGDFENPNKDAAGDPRSYTMGPITPRTTDEFAMVDVPQLFYEPFGVSAKSGRKKESKCKIVILGHAVVNEDSYMNELGYDMLANPNIIDFIDAQDLYRALQRPGREKRSKIGLSALLDAFGLKHKGAHNAGNNAYATLEAALAIVSVAKNLIFEHDEEWNAKTRDDWGPRYRPKYRGL